MLHVYKKQVLHINPTERTRPGIKIKQLIKQVLSYSGQDQKAFCLYRFQWDKTIGVLFNEAFEEFYIFSFFKTKVEVLSIFLKTAILPRKLSLMNGTIPVESLTNILPEISGHGEPKCWANLWP